MRLRELIFTGALMSMALVTLTARPANTLSNERSDGSAGTSERGAAISIAAPPSPLIAKDKILGSAYYDTLSILNSSNQCSDFFGGSAGAVEVFKGYMSNVRRDHVTEKVGMRMFGPSTTILNAATKLTYRLFDKVAINANGPFYHQRMGPASPNIPNIGTFKPNSREIRVLMFLHELGHLMKGPDGHWLIPDDGSDEELSSSNSRRIEQLCGEQIRELSKPQTDLHVAKDKKARELLALRSASSTSAP
jgi:hypothetical protein